MTVDDSNIVTPIRNALDSLKRMARELNDAKHDDVFALKGVLLWGWHVVDILVYRRLQPERDTFDSWMQEYLHEGETTFHVGRDAFWDESRYLSPLELLDILSETELSILKPEFYQGWQDRTVRCQELRQHVARLTGSTISEQQRNQLLMLLAGYNRLIRLPAAISFDTDPIWQALPALFDLAEALMDKTSTEASVLLQALGECRTAASAN